MTNVLIYADTVRTPELRQEIPHAVTDALLYGETEGRRFAVVRSLEVARMSEIEGLEVIPEEELGLDDLQADGMTVAEAHLELALRACRRFELDRAVIPPAFPTELADYLRAAGLELTVARDLFEHRRRKKTSAQVEGIRRAQQAADAANAAIAEVLRGAQISGDRVLFEGEPLTSERLKAAASAAVTASGCSAEEFIVAHGAQTCIGHHHGSGEIAPGEPITVDIWPRDAATACYTDMTRTFVAGEVDDELREYHRLCKAALEHALAAIRPGVLASEVYRVAAEVFEEAGQPTLLSKKPGTVLDEGFFHRLGHGVGLEVHEPPYLSPAGEEIVAGDVLAVEPGCYRQGFGGVRLEDTVLVTDDGVEVFGSYPYELEP
jgi:Xaa-Pro aminopeptidase